MNQKTWWYYKPKRGKKKLIPYIVQNFIANEFNEYFPEVVNIFDTNLVYFIRMYYPSYYDSLIHRDEVSDNYVRKHMDIAFEEINEQTRFIEFYCDYSMDTVLCFAVAWDLKPLRKLIRDH
jgi:hypothetical protein